MAKKTLDDIVRLTGFSKTTISRVLNGKAEQFRISPETRRKVLQTAKEIDYRTSFMAQNLRQRSGSMIGLAVPDLSNPFFASLASSIVVEAKKYDFLVMLFDTQDDVKAEQGALETMTDYGVDGIIVIPCGEKPDRLEKISRGTPVILVDRYFPQSFLPYVSTNNYEGAYMAMNHLLNAGHRNILCICGPEVSVTTQERLRGCRRAVELYGHGARLSVSGDEFSIQNGYIETKLALQQSDPPTAIFALSTTILLGTIKALREQEKVIPDDVSVISFDDNMNLDFMNPPITRVAQPVRSMGVAAVKMLTTCIREQTQLKSRMLMTPNMMVRDSVKIINIE